MNYLKHLYQHILYFEINIQIYYLENILGIIEYCFLYQLCNLLTLMEANRLTNNYIPPCILLSIFIMLLFDMCDDHMHCSNIMLLFTIDSICNWSHWTNKVISNVELHQIFMVSVKINGNHNLNIDYHLLKVGNRNFK